MTYRTITHVLYDMDGLLLDTEPFYTQVTQEIVGRYGKTFDWSVKSQMIGKKAGTAARILVEALDLPITPEDYLRERKALLNALFPTAQPLPGAVALTRHLHRHQIPQAVATSSEQEMFRLKTTHHQEWFRCFQVIITGDDPEVKEGKPAPDIFLAAARRLGAQPECCLVFEDAPAGMEAALNAGMAAVVVPDSNMDPAVFEAAHQCLKDLTEFQPGPWGLPEYPSSL